MPVYSVLEGRFELVVGNATHIRNVPGRKTDVKDSEWLADLVRHGLIRKSFVPPRPLRELRELMRYRRKLVESEVDERNRLLKLLETGNIKLASVISDVFSIWGRRMLRALIEGMATPDAMAELALRRMRTKIPLIAEALEGRLLEHHRYLLAMQLGRVEQVEATIAQLDQRIDQTLEPYREHLARLKQIPGVDRVIAATLIAELGVDMSVFPTAGHAAAWAGVCPGNHQSGGKSQPHAVRRGNVHLQQALVQAAVCASRTKGCYLREKYWRLKARRGPKRAAMAIAHKILRAAYTMLANHLNYHDLGAAYLDERARTETRTQLVRRLEQMGFTVTLTEKGAAAMPA